MRSKSATGAQIGMPPGIGDDPAWPGLRVHGAAADPRRAGHRLPGRQPQQRAGADVDGQHPQAAVQRRHQPGLRGAGVAFRAARGVDHDQVPAVQVGDAVRDAFGDLHVVPEGRQDAGDPVRRRRERVPRVAVRPAAGQDQGSGQPRSSRRRRPRSGWCTSGCRRRPATAPSGRCRPAGGGRAGTAPGRSRVRPRG